jgi:NAD(P)-dependent dehydrogenase (short-subunit alcohol dehydrogenase family)
MIQNASNSVAEPPQSVPQMPSFRLDGRRALVTGAGRGIGFALAAALAQFGAEVHLAARSIVEVEQGATAIRRTGGKAQPLPLDITDVDTVRRTIAAQSPFDILVSNAGTNRPKSIATVTPEDYAAVFDLNVRATFFMAQAVVRRLLEEGRRGSIIHISSQMGHVGAPDRTLYCASKHAIEGLTKAMAVELAPAGIRVNSIAPTFIETPMTRPYLADQAFRESVLTKIKLGRLGKVEDLMGAVVFLASDASALVTGTSLAVDGGWTAE